MADIVFRRIRGRIIPIKLDKAERREMAQGAGLAAGGAGFSIGAGKAYKAIEKYQAKFANKAEEYAAEFIRLRSAVERGAKRKKKKIPGQMSLVDNGTKGFGVYRPKPLFDKSVKYAKLTKRLNLAAKISAGVGVTLGGALIGVGIEKLISPAQKRAESAGIGIDVGAGAIGSGLAAAGFGLASGLIKRKEITKALRTALKIKGM